VETVLTALAPVVVTLLLGFVAAWHHDFAAKDAAVLNRMVLLYAVPVALLSPSLLARADEVRARNKQPLHRRSYSTPAAKPLTIGLIGCSRKSPSGQILGRSWQPLSLSQKPMRSMENVFRNR
jgi:hypothetical protein